ncbi:MAG: hypothetical protein AB8G22_21805 [Saprospiraceae bacterium]
MKFTIYTLLIIFLASCGTPEKDYAGMADDLCKCMTPLSDLYDQVMEATEKQDTAAVELLADKFAQLSEDGEDCAAKLEEKYGDFVGEEEAKAKAALEQKCPKIAKMMGQGAE